MADEPRPNLADCSEPFVGMVLKLDDKHRETSADDLRAEAERLLMEFERDAQRQGIAMVEIDAAKYALAALLDEKVLCSEILAMAEWINEPLQMRLFDSFAAGEEFYQRIDDLRRDPAGPRILALEIYHLCLGLGFKGKYDDRRGEDQRRIVMDQIAEQVGQALGGDTLAPNAYSKNSSDEQDEQTASLLARIPLWAWPAASLGLVLLVALIMSMMVGSTVDGIRELAEGSH